MGTYYSTYVGCFLRVPVQNVPVTKSYYKKPSGKRTKSRFNSETGEEYELCTEIVNEKTDPSSDITDNDELDEDTFNTVGEYNEKERFFIPNSSSDLMDNIDTEYDYTLSLLNVNQEAEILSFKRKYSKYLHYYTKKYGKYEIDFGIVRNGS
jgi:hypothetical protein